MLSVTSLIQSRRLPQQWGQYRLEVTAPTMVASVPSESGVIHEAADVVLAKRGSGRRHPPRVPLAALAS